MDREEMIRNLRCCADPSVRACRQCSLEDGSGDRACTQALVSAAADMLEQDGRVLDECVKPEIKKAANVLSSLWDLLKENMAPQSEKPAGEMFRELGYEKERDNKFQTIYKNGEDEIIFAKDRRVVFSVIGNEEVAGFTYEVLPAVCKLLDEMGVDASCSIVEGGMEGK